MNCWLRGVLSLAIIALCLRAQPVEAQLPARDDVFRLQIQTDRSQYAVGDPISLRIVVRNNTNEVYSVPAFPPCYFVALSIADESGNQVPKATPRCAGYFNAVLAYRIPPGGEQVLKRVSGNVVTEWSDLAAFGYTLRAGTYVITAIPMIDGFQSQNGLRVNRFHTTEKPTSNVVRIRIH